MSIVHKSNIAIENNNSVEYIYPRTSADMVEFDNSTVEEELKKLSVNDSKYEIYEQNMTEKYNILNARVDTISALPDGSTSGDAELIDIRVKANGVVANSAGNAVREQIEYLEDNVTNILKTIYTKKWISAVSNDGLFTINPGALRETDGGNMSDIYSTVRCVTPYMELQGGVFEDALFVFDNPEYKYCIWIYETKSVSSAVCSCTQNSYIQGGSSAMIQKTENANYMRIGFARMDKAELTTNLDDPNSDYNTIRSSMHIYSPTVPDKTLSESGKTADAKTVGDIIRLTKKTEGELLDVEQNLSGTIAGVSYEIGNGVIKLTGESTGAIRIKLSGIFAAARSILPEWLTETIPSIETGKTYFLSRNLLSGDVNGGDITIGVRGRDNQRTIVENKPSVATQESAVIQLYIPSGLTFTDAIYSISLKMTNDLYGDVPYYWIPQLDEIARQISTEGDGSGLNGDRFMFLTDIHCEYNAGHYGALIRYLMQKTGINKLFFGGDLCQGDQPTSSANLDVAFGAYAQFDGITNVFPIIGNHEQNNPGANASRMSIMSTNEELYSLYIKRHEDKFGSLSTAGDYWTDNRVQKIRYFCIGCTYDSSITGETLSWLLTELERVPDNYTIVIISHLGITNDGSAMQLRGVFKPIAVALDKISARSTYTYTYKGVTYTADFTNTNVTVACALTGHCHFDGSFLTDTGIPIVSTCTDAYGKVDGIINPIFPRMTLGTDTEQAFDIVRINKTARRILITRVGALPEGAERNRVFSY